MCVDGRAANEFGFDIEAVLGPGVQPPGHPLDFGHYLRADAVPGKKQQIVIRHVVPPPKT